MKKYLFLITIQAIIIIISTYGQNGDGFQIEGTLNGLEKDTVIYLVLNETSDTIAITQSKNGKFNFIGKLVTSIEWASVRIANSNKWPTFFLENRGIRMDGQSTQWELATIVGSKETDLLNVLRRSIIPLQQQADSAVALRLEDKELEELGKRMFALREKFIEQHPNLAYSAWLIRNTTEFDVERKQLEFKRLAPEIQNSSFGSRLLAHIKAMQLRNSIKPGTVSPNFKLQALDGSIVSINEILKNNKLILIDFWASWCGPCRKFTPELKKIYNEFHHMGFTIVSISSDNNKNAWKMAVAIDSMYWLNAIPISESETPQEIFDINALPSMMLLDKAGRIVAFQSSASSLSSFGFDSHTIPNKREYLYKKIKELLEN